MKEESKILEARVTCPSGRIIADRKGRWWLNVLYVGELRNVTFIPLRCVVNLIQCVYNLNLQGDI